MGNIRGELWASQRAAAAALGKWYEDSRGTIRPRGLWGHQGIQTAHEESAKARDARRGRCYF